MHWDVINYKINMELPNLVPRFLGGDFGKFVNKPFSGEDRDAKHTTTFSYRDNKEMMPLL